MFRQVAFMQGRCDEISEALRITWLSEAEVANDLAVDTFWVVEWRFVAVDLHRGDGEPIAERFPTGVLQEMRLTDPVLPEKEESRVAAGEPVADCFDLATAAERER